MDGQAFFCCFINLDRSPDRRRAIEQQLADAGVKAVRITAVDCRHADTRYLPRLRRWIGGQLGAGEVGCAESHRLALRRLVESEAACGVILEDDAELAPEFRQLVEYLASQTAGWDLVRLEQRKPDVLAWTRLRLPAGRTLAVPRNTTFGSTAMLYSARGARLALRSLERGYMHPLDAHLGSLAGPKFCFLQLVPPVVVERSEVSQIGNRAGSPGEVARPSGRRAGLQPVFNRLLRLSGSILRRLGARAAAGRVGRHSTQTDQTPIHSDLGMNMAAALGSALERPKGGQG